MKAATIVLDVNFPFLRVSIHAAREGGDVRSMGDDSDDMVSIHAAREGGDTAKVF